MSPPYPLINLASPNANGLFPGGVRTSKRVTSIRTAPNFGLIPGQGGSNEVHLGLDDFATLPTDGNHNMAMLEKETGVASATGGGSAVNDHDFDDNGILALQAPHRPAKKTRHLEARDDSFDFLEDIAELHHPKDDDASSANVGGVSGAQDDLFANLEDILQIDAGLLHLEDDDASSATVGGVSGPPRMTRHGVAEDPAAVDSRELSLLVGAPAAVQDILFGNQWGPPIGGTEWASASAAGPAAPIGGIAQQAFIAGALAQQLRQLVTEQSDIIQGEANDIVNKTTSAAWLDRNYYENRKLHNPFDVHLYLVGAATEVVRQYNVVATALKVSLELCRTTDDKRLTVEDVDRLKFLLMPCTERLWYTGSDKPRTRTDLTIPCIRTAIGILASILRGAVMLTEQPNNTAAFNYGWHHDVYRNTDPDPEQKKGRANPVSQSEALKNMTRANYFSRAFRDEGASVTKIVDGIKTDNDALLSLLKKNNPDLGTYAVLQEIRTTFEKEYNDTDHCPVKQLLSTILSAGHKRIDPTLHQNAELAARIAVDLAAQFNSTRTRYKNMRAQTKKTNDGAAAAKVPAPTLGARREHLVGSFKQLHHEEQFIHIAIHAAKFMLNNPKLSEEDAIYYAEELTRYEEYTKQSGSAPFLPGHAQGKPLASYTGNAGPPAPPHVYEGHYPAPPPPLPPGFAPAEL